jgi:hypothetical protein
MQRIRSIPLSLSSVSLRVRPPRFAAPLEFQTATARVELIIPRFKGNSLKNGVADGTRTRNSQNHNLELYH